MLTEREAKKLALEAASVELDALAKSGRLYGGEMADEDVDKIIRYLADIQFGIAERLSRLNIHDIRKQKQRSQQAS